MRRRDDTHISRDHPLPSHPYNRTRLYCTQQACLQITRHIAYLVKKKCSPVRLFKLPRTPLSICTGEGSPFVTEELRAYQFAWNSCTIDGYKWCMRPPTAVMYALRENLFPRASLAVE